MSFKEQLEMAKNSGRPYRVVQTPDGAFVEYLTQEEIAKRDEEMEKARRWAARDEVLSCEQQALRAMRELTLSMAVPGSVPDTDVAAAKARLLELERKIRQKRAEFQGRPPREE